MRNRSAIVSVAYTEPTAISNAPITQAGLVSSVSGTACSSGNENTVAVASPSYDTYPRAACALNHSRT